MLDVRVSASADPEALVAFVKRLAGSGRGAPVTKTAMSRIVGDIRDGRAPAGVRTLRTALDTAAVPRPRAGSEGTETLCEAVGRDALVVLSDTETVDLARSLAELTGHGMRILLTGAQAKRLAALRRVLPAAVAGRVVDRLPPLPAADLRRLRRLLATVGADPARRSGQQLPPESALPAPEDVALICERASRTVTGAETGETRAVPALLRDLDVDRRAAVTQVARCVLRCLGRLAEAPEPDQLRDVVGRLVHGGMRLEFESLQGLAARQRDDRADSRFAVEATRPLPDGGEAVIRRYLDFLEDGGRGRSYFRPQEQRDADPLLRGFLVDGEQPHTYDQVLAVAHHVHLAHRDGEIARLCSGLGLDAPGGAEDLPALTDALDRIAAAARSVGAIRHDVLFLQRGSPVAVPDLAAAERVARAIVDYDDQGDPLEARDELERFAESVTASIGADAMAPEHEAVVAALVAQDAEAYSTALVELGQARHEITERAELKRLLAELARTHPDLARTWAADAERGVPGFGFLRMMGSAELLSAIPPADAADLVVVLGAGSLQADGLLLTAAAPRMLAVVGDEPRAESSGTTLIEVLTAASARFLRGIGDRAVPAAGTAPDDAAAVPSVPTQAGPSAMERTGTTTAANGTRAVPRPGTGAAPADGARRPSTPSAMVRAARDDRS